MGLKDEDGSVQTDQRAIFDFHDAAGQGDLQAVKRFVNNGGNVNAKDWFGRTALHLAAFAGHVGVVQYLVESGAALDAKDKSGVTALHSAALRGFSLVVETLVKNRANVDAKTTRSGSTALHCAAVGGYILVVESLVENGANVDVKNKYGKTALDYAAEKGHVDVREYLVEIVENNEERRRPIGSIGAYKNIGRLLKQNRSLRDAVSKSEDENNRLKTTNATIQAENKRLNAENKKLVRKNGNDGVENGENQFEESSALIGNSEGLIDEISRLKSHCTKLSQHNMNLTLQVAELEEELQGYRKKDENKSDAAHFRENSKQNEMKQENGDNFLEKRSESEHADGASKDEENEFPKQGRPTELGKFRNCYNCVVSCTSIVVSFIFFCMKLPLCMKRFEREIHNDFCQLHIIECMKRFKREIKKDLSQLDRVKFPDEDCKVKKCSEAFEDFRHLSIIEKNPKFFKSIGEGDNLESVLESAMETVKGEEHPVMFRMHYRENQNGKKRTGHCVAFMPRSGKFLDVEKDDYWYPQKDKLWKTVCGIDVWKVDKQVAKTFWERCGLKNCKAECMPRVNELN